MTISMQQIENIGWLTLNKPDRANAYDQEMLDQIEQALNNFLKAGIKVLIIDSMGEGAFCGGADLNNIKNADPTDALDLRSQVVFDKIAKAPIPTIAAIQGAAVAGGFELCLACDLRIISEKARFALPEPALGLIPSAGGCTRLTRIVGPARAKEVILGGRWITAHMALEWGLVMEISPDPRSRAFELAKTISNRDPLALRLAKSIIDFSDLSGSLQAERVSEALLYSLKNRPRQ